MPFSIDKFAQLRPYLYHLTSRENFEPILSAGGLYPASKLFGFADAKEQMGMRRGSRRDLQVKEWTVSIRDQAPLHAGNIEFEPGWDLPRFVRHVNDHVFFWPGDKDGPIPAGQRHFERYSGENPLILRIETLSLFDQPKEILPCFCRYNSGAPRISNRKKSPRGGSTYLLAERAGFTASEVQEVVFRDRVSLPNGLCFRLLQQDYWSVHYYSDAFFGEPEFPEGSPSDNSFGSNIMD